MKISKQCPFTQPHIICRVLRYSQNRILVRTRGDIHHNCKLGVFHNYAELDPPPYSLHLWSQTPHICTNKDRKGGVGLKDFNMWSQTITYILWIQYDESDSPHMKLICWVNYEFEESDSKTVWTSQCFYRDKPASSCWLIIEFAYLWNKLPICTSQRNRSILNYYFEKPIYQGDLKT